MNFFENHENFHFMIFIFKFMMFSNFMNILQIHILKNNDFSMSELFSKFVIFFECFNIFLNL